MTRFHVLKVSNEEVLYYEKNLFSRKILSDEYYLKFSIEKLPGEEFYTRKLNVEFIFSIGKVHDKYIFL